MLKPHRKPQRLPRRRLPPPAEVPTAPAHDPAPPVDVQTVDEHPDFDAIRRMIEAAYT